MGNEKALVAHLFLTIYTTFADTNGNKMNEEQRKLSKAELRRKEAFDAENERRIAEGYVRHDLTVSVAKANWLGLLMTMPFVLILMGLFTVLTPMDYEESGMAEASFFPLVVVAVVLLLTVLHELIHGAVFGWFAPHRYKAIQFGVIWSMMTPYCACTEPLTRNQYILGAAMPTIVVGFLPAAIAIAMNDLGWFVIALLMVIGGGGDMLIILKLLMFRAKGKDAVFCDHPTLPGLVAYTQLGTDRILLRPWREEDAEALFKYASDAEVGPRAGWAPHRSVEESLEIIRTVFHNDTTWAIVWKETQEPIGAIGYGPSCECDLPARPDEPTVGYWVGKPYWNRGICSEALRLLLEHVCSTTAIPSLISGHYVDNPASGRVMEKCGFKATGETCYSPKLVGGADRPTRVLRWERGGAKVQK